MAQPPTDRTPPRGTALWCYLTALVAVPLVGVGVLTALIAVHTSGDVDSARRAEAAVRAVARLDAARTAVEREILPTLAVAVIDDPAAATQLGVAPWMLASARSVAADGTAQARTATDAALAAVAAGSPGAAVAEHVTADLAGLRAGVDRGQVRLEQLYLGYLDASNDLMTAECDAAAAAVSEGVPARTARAVQDVETIATLTQTASRQTPLYLGSLFAPDTALIGSRLAWETGWLSYTDAQRRMEELSQEPLRAAWAQLRESELVTGLDALLTPASTPAAPTRDVGRLTDLLLRSADRDAALAGLVGTAIDDVLAMAAADREDAAAVLRRTLELGAGLLLVAALGAVWLGRTVSRSLGVLAGQATRISEGELVEVEVRGPREVRTVSAALGAAVAGLRRIQDQARAVARGDLDDALLDRPLPGPLGEVVHASIRQIVTSVRQREELQFALAHRATHDPLTELPNRAQALTLVTSALHRARRSGR
ncbi:hypothetical protein JOD57_002008 [Geodermatophilus bullaregiensis]|uniref:GGDEF domain-containing protein n=1 Tax=Geodermatophilus bullaregiensis TaxID=1564160 RepID=UPI00195E3262|nr:GGDEF domain-containing protein [Geodermatophilus bullaregiensis]MBM7806171.1 hypothetical protein [Geodermatophilus bullaregiensis]